MAGPLTEEAENWRMHAQNILKSLPPPSIPLLPDEQAFDTTKYTNRLDFGPADAWQKCAESIEQYDADECKAHREEIDTLLVFAGLFSAVLTAFTVESYKWLQDDPNDTIIALLSQLAQTPGGAQTAPAPTGLPDAVSARINAYWFLSLTLSLSAALVAILCKQWVREFERHGNQSHRQYIGIRQMKLEGFEPWGVASIIAAIPLLLQSALGLFALGLVELLWNLHFAVAITALVPTLAAVLFYTLTTLLPGLQIVYNCFRQDSTLPQCPFKSPQSLLTIRTLLGLLALFDHFARPWDTLREVWMVYTLNTLFRCTAWVVGLLRALQNLDVRRRLLDFRSRTNRLGAWAMIDAEFNTTRDSYQPTNYPAPLPSCFRALGWLSDHIEHPGIQRRIFLAAWDIVNTPKDSPYTAISPFIMHHSLSFLRSLALKSQRSRGHAFDFRRYLAWRNQEAAPYLEALRYAQDVGLGHGFVAELAVRHIARIDLRSANLIFRDNIISLDEETRHSMLLQILRREAATAAAIPDQRALILLVSQSLGPCLSREELACVVAVYFQALYASGTHIFDDRGGLQDLFLLVVRCMAVSNSADYDATLAAQSTEIETALCGLVLALDQCFDRLTTDSAVTAAPFDYAFAGELMEHPARRDVYLGLLARILSGPVTHRGDMSAAETRFEQTVVRLANQTEEICVHEETRRANPPSAAQHGINILAGPTHAPSHLGDAAPAGDAALGPFRAIQVHETDSSGVTEG